MYFLQYRGKYTKTMTGNQYELKNKRSKISILLIRADFLQNTTDVKRIAAMILKIKASEEKLMKNSEQKKPKREDIYYQFYNTKSVQSTTDLTGLTPSLPLSEEDAESYADIYGMPIPEDFPHYKENKKEKH
jgi:hypothetical protein